MTVDSYFSQYGFSPFIPDALRAKITAYQEGLFGTLPLQASLDVETYVSQVIRGQIKDDFILLGFGGHGVASSGFHYYIKKDSIALFIQARYLGNQDDDERMAAKLTMAETLIEAKIPDGKKLIVIDSDFTVLRGWKLYEGFPETLEYQVSDDDVLMVAFNSL
jgi:hypothetical protein